MDETVSGRSAPRTRADYNAEIERVLEALRRGNAQIEEDRAEILRVRAAARVAEEHAEASLARLEAGLALLRKGSAVHVEATA